MTFNERVSELASLIGTDIGSLILKTGDLSTLNTTDKRSIVAAINELYSAGGGVGSVEVSIEANNIIKRKIDGLYAAIDTPPDISSFTNALDASLQK